MRYFYCYTTQTVVYLYSTVVRFLIWSRIAINVNIVFVTLPVPSRGKKKKLLRNRKQKMLDQLINYTEETIFRNSRNGRLEHRYMYICHLPEAVLHYSRCWTDRILQQQQQQYSVHFLLVGDTFFPNGDAPRPVTKITF